MTQAFKLSIAKRFWKWIVSGIVAIGVGSWAAIHWLIAGAASTVAVATTAGVVKTVAVATAVVATTAFSFNFGDKGSSLGTYAEKAFVLAGEGKKTEALKHTDQLVLELDKHLDVLKSDLETAQSLPVSSELPEKERKAKEDDLKVIQQLLDMGQLQQQVVQLLRYDVLRKLDELSEREWIDNICNILKENPDDAEKITESFLSAIGTNIASKEVWSLVRKEIPSDARGILSLWLIKNNTTDATASVKDCEIFYNELLSYSAESDSAAEILLAYTDNLDSLTKGIDRRSATRTANDMLETYIALFPDSDLGSTAAHLRLGGIEPGEKRNRKIRALVDRYSGTVMAKNLLAAYTKVLLEDGEYQKALVNLDSEGKLNTIKTEQEAIDSLLALVKKATSIQSTAIPNRYGDPKAKSKNGTQKIVTPFLICLGLSRELGDSGDYSTASGLLFVAMEKAGMLPKNLMTGQAMHKLSSLGDTSEPNIARNIASYLQTLAMYTQKDTKKADSRLAELERETLPESLRPYVLYLLARRATENKKYAKAMQYAKAAVETMPTSPILVSLSSKINEAKQKEEVHARIAEQQKKHLAAAESAQTAEEAISHYKKVSDLSLALNDIEQAIGIHLLIVEKFPENRQAPVALDESIKILKSRGEKQFASRIEILRKKLVDTYPDSDQAKYYQMKIRPAGK